MNKELLRFDWKKGKNLFLSLLFLLFLLFFLLKTGWFPRLRFSYFNGNRQAFLNSRVTNVFSFFELWLPLFYSFGILYLNATDLKSEEKEFLSTLPFPAEKYLIMRSLLISLVAIILSLPLCRTAYLFLSRYEDNLTLLYLLCALFSTWVNVIFFMGLGTLFLHFTEYFGITISVILFLNFLDYGNQSRFSGTNTFFPLCFFQPINRSGFFSKQNRLSVAWLTFSVVALFTKANRTEVKNV